MSAPPPPWYANLLFASIGACTGTAMTHPIDVARVNVQLSAKKSSWVESLATTLRERGVRASFVGLSAGLLRQLLYGTARFGSFATFQDWRKASTHKKILDPYEKVGLAMLSGGIAGLVGNPADVALTRMASDLKLAPAQRRGYTNGFNAMYRIGREEGFTKGLMLGVTPNIVRSMVINTLMLATYAQSKDWLTERGGFRDGLPVHFAAANAAAFSTALFGVPADLIKTKLQHENFGKLGGVRGVLGGILKERGPLGLWAGFFPLWAKLAPHTVITMSVMEACRGAWIAAATSGAQTSRLA